MSDNSFGSIKMQDGSIFNWIAGSIDGEINGHIQKENGEIKKGTSGWYRTTSPIEAAQTVGKVA